MTGHLRRFVFGVTCLYHAHSRPLVGLIVIFQGGRHLEKAKASQHRPFHRCYDRSFGSRFGVDVERNSGGVRREKPRCEADQPGESSPVIALGR